MLKIKSTAVAAAVSAALLTSFVAQAAERGGIYLRGDLGMSVTYDVEGDLRYGALGAGTPVDTETDREHGLSGGIGIGYAFNDMFRADATLTHTRMGDVDGDATFTSVGATLPGEIEGLRSTSLMVSGHWDLHQTLGLTGDWQPYLSAGLGIARNDFDGYRINTTALYDGGATTSFAWMLGGGVAFKASDAWLVDLSYAYQDLGKLEGGDQIVEPTAIAVDKGLEVDNLTSHRLMIGLRYQF